MLVPIRRKSSSEVAAPESRAHHVDLPRSPSAASRWLPRTVLALAVALLSCEARVGDQADEPPLGTVAQGLDTDSDGMDDAWETTHFGNLSQTAAGDYDSDGMTNLEEYTHGFLPTVNDGFDDADGDRYPNVFEVRRGSNPNSASSTPTANYTVNAAGGGTHTTIGAALGAANVANGAYQIIAVAPGTYKGGANLRDVTITSAKPKLLIIGLEGAAKTVVDGELANYGWVISNSAVIASMTFQKMTVAHYVDGVGKEARFVDLIVRDNVGPSWAAGVHVNAAAKVNIVGSTFLNNTGATAAQQIWIGAGAGTIVNTVVWSSGTGTMLAKQTSATLTTNYCLAKGHTLSGTGNLAGSVDPKLRADGHLLWDSPLRAAGGSLSQSRIDIDGELRPSASPDIGVDQFIDSDSDDLADKWELDEAGNLTTLTSRSQDVDSDGLSNEQEYAGGSKPTVADTDGDGLSDGDEVSVHSTSPVKADTDGDDMPDGWEVNSGLSPTVSNRFEDADGDGYPNVFEFAGGSNPTDAQSKPTPNFVVNGAGGGTHTTIGAAVTAANVANGAYQIIGIAPGSYSGASNDITLPTTKPKFLVIGLEGAGKTFLEGASWGWQVQNSAVISSLTFRGRFQAIAVNAPGHEVRLVDLVIRDNANTSWPAAVDVIASAKVYVVGSTFLNNAGPSQHRQMKIDTAGNVTLLNTVIWGTDAGTTIARNGSGTLTANNSLAKGMTLTGTGNLAGTVDPKLRPSDIHLLWDSPLRGAGGTVAQSRIDIDGELRPTSAPDVGVDQFKDSDSDQLADAWEVEYAGNLTTLTSRTQDGDGDGLSNEGEYANRTNPGVADTDGDGVSDGAEVLTHGSNPLSADTDGDEMPDNWEVTNGISPTVSNRFEDADGDGYPNIFEFVGGSNPADAQSKPTPNFVVNGAGGGTHTTIGAAVTAANVANGAYQIIGIAPGAYSGASNDITLTTAKPKFLVIGLEGAAKTFLEGASWGWQVQNTAVISSLTFRGRFQAIAVNAPGHEVRLVDLVIRDNANTSWPAAVDVIASAKLYVVGSTFLNNAGPSQHRQMKIDAGGNVTLLNTVIWGTNAGTTIAKTGTLTANNSLAKGMTLTGTGNLAGTVDPKLRATDIHLLWDSPLRGAGGTVAQSRIDIDGELRPTSAPDIGVDQFKDSDSDQLADVWELEYAGNLTTLTNRTQDGDADGLSNEGEYANRTNPGVADTDGDGVSDGAEVLTHGSNPLSADTDGDEMPDGWEVAYGLSPTLSNRFEDADGDGYPNIFEYAGGTNPADLQSKPTPNFVVDGAGGGTHTTVGAAVTAADVANGAYQIIGIKPGAYSGASNDVTLTTAKPKFLVIGLQGAGKTFIEGAASWGWMVQNSAVISSLTFRGRYQGVAVNAAGHEVRLVDLVIRDNANTSWPAAVDVIAATNVYVVGSTFANNVGPSPYVQMKIATGASVTLLNTLVWGTQPGTTISNVGTLTANNSLVKGMTLAGSGNLAGTVNPKLRSDLHLRASSPLRGAGAAVAQSRIDVDGELRPLSGRDIGADQFVDADADSLPDSWELSNFGNTTTVAGSADEDADLLSNAAEYDLETDWLDPDTDKDGVYDGIEVAVGINPLVADADELGSDMNGDGVIESIGAQLGYQLNQLDTDGDGVSNTDEALMCTNPLRPDTDGDGVQDNIDVFPHDPLVSAIPSNPEDVTPPQITLTAPWYAAAN